jgi:cobalt/nickel transport system permease protein
MFTYRYFFVFVEEMHRMKVARKARAFHGGRHLLDKHGMRTISFTAGMILVRAYQRGLTIYDALITRGYDGNIRTLKPLRFDILDFMFCSVFFSMSIMLMFYDILVIQ